jgi:hypothetical protein
MRIDAKLFAVVAMLALALALAACGGDDDDDEAAPPAGTTSAETAVVSVPAYRKKRRFARSQWWRLGDVPSSGTS